MDRRMNFEDEYLDLLDYVVKRGEDRNDRTGVGTRAVFGQQLRIDLAQGFPLMTTKKMGLKSIISELLWFLEGSGDERRLAEILHGTRDPEKKTIWSPNAEHTTGSAFKPIRPGDLGRVYGVQWRKWQGHTLKESGDYLGHPNEPNGVTHSNAKVLIEEFDQVKRLISVLKSNPTDRRMILSAWNPGELHKMALPPCHMFAQFYVDIKKNTLSCQMYMRSVDTFLGLPYNIASYAALTQMIAEVTGYGLGELIICMGDTHIYQNHMDQVEELLSRERFMPPTLKFGRKITDIDDFKMEDFILENYSSHGPLRAPMAV